MNTEAQALRSLPLEAFEHPQPGDDWDRSPLADLSDARLVAAVVSAITPPKAAPPSSFVLHAPLELLARAALLPHVAPAARAAARRQIAAVGVRYAHAGAEVETPSDSFPGDDVALATLMGSLRGGDAQGVDTALCFLLPRVSLGRLRAAFVDELVPRLGAAAHAPILLAALPRMADRNASVGGLLRAPLRALAAVDDRLSWHQETAAPVEPATSTDPARALFEALASPPRLKSSSSIAPTMLAVERSGDAARLLSGPVQALAVHQAERVLLRVAAQSMLQDDPAHAPYGWTHCLTLPQALLANADAATDTRALVAVAATQVLGFRATLGRVALAADAAVHTPAASESPKGRSRGDSSHGPRRGPSWPLGGGRRVSSAWGPSHTELVTALATGAALHPDAHLAKYTLACFDAAARDPDAAPLFLAAAAHLGAWWEERAKVQGRVAPG